MLTWCKMLALAQMMVIGRSPTERSVPSRRHRGLMQLRLVLLLHLSPGLEPLQLLLGPLHLEPLPLVHLYLVPLLLLLLLRVLPLPLVGYCHSQRSQMSSLVPRSVVQLRR